MESVTESSKAISESLCELSIQEPSDQSSDSFLFSKNGSFKIAVEKVFLSYPDWNSKAVLVEKLKDSGLELDKVAQDFDKLTPPESSKNIIFRFIYYDDKSYAFAWIEKITDAMKAKPRKIQLRKCNGKRRKFNYAIPIYDPTVDSDAFDLILDDVEQCYWPMVLRRVLHDDEDFGDNYKSDEDYVEVVNEDAVKDVNEDANEDDVDEYKDGFEFRQIIRMRFRPKKAIKKMTTTTTNITIRIICILNNVEGDYGRVSARVKFVNEDYNDEINYEYERWRGLKWLKIYICILCFW